MTPWEPPQLLVGPLHLFVGEGLDGAGDTWVSSGEGCVCPDQQPISHPRGDVDVLWRAGSRSGFPLQSLANIHIYVPTHRANNSGGQIDRLEGTQRTLHKRGCGKADQVLREFWSPGGKFREEARAWSMKFPAEPESTRAVETTLEGQPPREPERVWWKTMIIEYSCLPWEIDGHGATSLL